MDFRTLLPLALALCAACDPTSDDESARKGNDSADVEYPPCDETTTEVAIDEVTALGFSAADVLALTETSSTDSFEWLSTSEVVDLALGVTQDGDGARYIDRQDPGGSTMECLSRVEVDVRFSFVTSDGVFEEEFGGTLTAEEASSASLNQIMDGAGVQGSYSFPENSYEPGIRWQMTFGPDVRQGSVEVSYSRDMGDGVASSTRETVGVWPPGSFEK